MAFIGKAFTIVSILLLPAFALAEQQPETGSEVVSTSVDENTSEKMLDSKTPPAEQEPEPVLPVVAPYTASTLNLDNSSARTVVTNYYNNYGVWAGVFKIDKIKNIQIKYFGDRRAVVHVVYSYIPVNPGRHRKPGVDTRTFTLIKHKDWSVITMGHHQSANIK